jgi:hypothetical protein
VDAWCSILTISLVTSLPQSGRSNAISHTVPETVLDTRESAFGHHTRHRVDQCDMGEVADRIPLQLRRQRRGDASGNPGCVEQASLVLAPCPPLEELAAGRAAC